jgi:carboxyl-terminal processing protease
LSLREADLTRHLSNPKGGETPAVKPAEPAKEVPPGAKGEGKEKFADKTGPVEFGTKDDVQLNQALNLLKGLKVTPSKPTVADSNAPSPTPSK